jgi:hypothetical protein
VGDRDVFDEDALIFTKILEIVASESGTQIGYDAIWHSKPMYNVLQQVGCLFCYSHDEWFVFNPLGEFVNGDINISKTSWGWLERPYHVQSPACKRPGSGDGLKGLCWNMDLLGEKLTTLTPMDESFRIRHGGWPIERSSESLANKVSRGYMVAA